MPSYEIEHSVPLTPSQQDALAEAVTKIHSETFHALRIFVNVRFTDIAHQPVYIAGKRSHPNRILGTVRHGPSRTRQHYDRLCHALQTAWTDIVVTPAINHGTAEPRALELWGIFVFGSIVAGMEGGFLLPEAGKDAEWVREHWGEFRQKAEEGREEFAGLLEDAKGWGLGL